MNHTMTENAALPNAAAGILTAGALGFLAFHGFAMPQIVTPDLSLFGAGVLARAYDDAALETCLDVERDDETGVWVWACLNPATGRTSLVPERIDFQTETDHYGDTVC